MQKRALLFLIVIVFLGCFLLVFMNIRVFRQKRILADELKLWQERLAETNRQAEELNEKISESQTDAYIERFARENLGLKKPGETVVVFIDEENEEIGDKEIMPGFWQKIKKLFSF